MSGLRFVSAELVAMAILAPLNVPIVHSTSDLLTPPLVRVRRVPGEPRTHFDDPAHIEYLCFGATFDAARVLAERCWDAFEFAYAHGFPVGAAPSTTWVTVDATATVLPPAEVPWANPDVRVFQGTHQIVTRGVPVGRDVPAV